MLPRLLVALFAGWIALSPAQSRAANDELVIGITQFPSTLHPNIDSMVAKSYVLGMTQRPFTAYDQDWELACFLCTELPTFENGKAVREPLPEGVEGQAEGREGVALTYTIQPGSDLGRRHAGHHRGRAVHLRGRQASRERDRERRAVPTDSRHRRDRRQDLYHARRSDHVRLQRASATSAFCRRISSGRSSRPIPRLIAIAPPSIPTRPILACGSAPIGSARCRAAPTSRSSPTRLGGARRRTSSESWSR